MYKLHRDFEPFTPVSFSELQAIADAPVVQRAALTMPIWIKAFSVYRVGEDWFLCVLGRNGERGIAPCSERMSYLYPLLREKLLPYFLGQDARELETLLHTAFISDLNYKIQGLAWWCCVAYVESAVLDMLARVAGVPVTDLLGGRKRNELDIYVASGNRHTTPEEEIEVLQARVDEVGARAIKFKLGGRMSRNADSLPGRTERLLQLARSHFGPDMIIHTDGNGSFDAEKGIQIGKIVEDIDAYFYEEPCPFDDLWATKAVADALTVPIAFGEQETSLRRFAWIIENNAAQVLQPDLQYTGGFIQCIKIARMAKAAGIPVTPHVSGGFPAYNMLLFCSVIEKAGHYHEYKHFKGVEDCVPGGLKVEKGKIAIPGGIGLGLELGFVLEGETVLTLEE